MASVRWAPPGARRAGPTFAVSRLVVLQLEFLRLAVARPAVPQHAARRAVQLGVLQGAQPGPRVGQVPPSARHVAHRG